MSAQTTQDTIDFAARLGAALAAHGAPANRIEQALHFLVTDLGLTGTFSATPTMLLMSFGPEHQVRLMRIETMTLDLGRLAQLDALFNAVAQGAVSPREGTAQIDAIIDAPAVQSAPLDWVCLALTSAAAAAVFGGGWVEIGAGLVAGGVLGGVMLGAQRSPTVASMLEPLGAFLVALSMHLFAARVLPIDLDPVILAGIIVLIPGLTLTVGVTELVNRHTSAGVARLGSVLTTCLLLVFGVAFGRGLGRLWVGEVEATLATPLPQWTLALAFVVAVGSICVLFRVPRRELGWAVLVAGLGFLALVLSGQVFRPEAAAFFGAVTIGCGSNAYARFFDRPATITRMPGLVFLVPGSLGFLSLQGLSQGEPLVAVSTAGQMGIIATSLVVGLVVAARLLPPRKAL